ncbi:aquaporin [Nocardioides sp.]|uniref:aquaporin n=1 Tax=Nocardioides sp. TaxID=35761 RepID=UPI003526C5D1
MPETPPLARRLAAEALGTLVLVLLGVGAAVTSGGDLVATALAFGLTMLVLVAALGRVSGGHVNPAISLGAAASGRLSWRDAAAYGGAQLAGGLAGGLVLWVLLQGFPGFSSERNFGQNGFGADSPNGYAWWAALLLEMVMTAVLVSVVLTVTDRRQPHPALAPVAIGLALTGIHLASFAATGTSVNPARSLGANAFAGAHAVGQLWLFFLAPLLGGLAAGVLHPLLFGRDDQQTRGADVRRSPEAAEDPTTWDPAAPAAVATPEWPESWPDPGPPREWGQPATPADATPWRPPPGALGDVAPATPEPAPGEPGFPPPPNEPYWSQQLPRDWEVPDEGDDDGRTEVRPSDGS